jgi:deazaflavin-dependent oxidoreductase (nitroreductase family)
MKSAVDRRIVVTQNRRVAEPGTELVDAAAREREVHLTTNGRKTGKPHRVTIWTGTDGEHIYVRSGQGMRRHWPQNLMARGDGVLEVGRMTVKVKPRHVTDPAEARAVSALYRRKYGAFVKASKPGEDLNLGEQATFDLVPAEAGG